MFKEIILHIGMHKTATTSIQGFCGEHANKLQNKFDTFYPTFSNPSRSKIFNHSIPFYSIFSNEPEKYSININQGINTKELAEESNKIFKKQFRNRVEKTNASRLLISGEDISRLNHIEMTRMKNFLSKFLEEDGKFTVILFLRNPISYCQSALQQRVKSGLGSIDHCLQNFLNSSGTLYDTRLEPAKRVFGKENIKIVDFDVAKTIEFGPVEAFFNCIDIKIPKVLLKAQNIKNESISNESLHLISEINKLEPRFIDKNPNPIREKMDLQRFFSIKGTKYELPQEKQTLLMEESKKTIRKLKNIYNFDFQDTNLKETKSIPFNQDTLKEIKSIIDNHQDKTSQEKMLEAYNNIVSA
ncbi:hypothetical protein NBRC116188_06050 [Oceaniserpentilla sp. 4NH20-0058]|uniref:hypothetical protein n=1 Tax=Oceaniserpentilla sp. 4NH20-0058 TaxID=3127660 RepID=UPI0031064FF4